MSSVSLKTLETFSTDFNAQSNTVQHVARNAITHTNLSKALIDPSRADTLHTTFSDELDINTKISDQKSSGRCWLFGFLNVLRAHTVHKYDLDSSFEFSQNYLFFWDQFEKCNYFLHNMWELRDRPTDEEHVREMLKEPLSDGGQWHMIQNIVSKYGVVPDYCMEETYQANHTERMTGILCGRLREFAKELRTKTIQDPKQTIETMLYEVYCVLCMFLGEPPKTIQWEYTPSSENWAKEQWKQTKKQKQKNSTTHMTSRSQSVSSSAKTPRGEPATTPSSGAKAKAKAKAKANTKTHPPSSHSGIDKKPYEQSVSMTPVEFYHKYVQFPLDEYVTVIHYPARERPYQRRFTVKFLNNMVNGRNPELHNVTLTDFKTLTRRSIDAGEPVWFCADIGKDTSTKFGILDPIAFNYQNVLKFDPHSWDKGARMEYKDGVPNHAMVLRGYHIDNKQAKCPPPTVPTPKAAHRATGAATRRRSSTSAGMSKPTNKSGTQKAHQKGGSVRPPDVRTHTHTHTHTHTRKTNCDDTQRWLVENSWGEFSGKDGNLVMSDEWFDRHVFEIAIHKKHLKGIWKESHPDIIELEMWDVFGSLFH